MMHRLGLVRALLVDQRQNGRQGLRRSCTICATASRSGAAGASFGGSDGVAAAWETASRDTNAWIREAPTRQWTKQPSMNTTAIAGDPAGVTRRAMISVSTTAVQKTARARLVHADGTGPGPR